jgi:hypothetical protein
VSIRVGSGTTAAASWSTTVSQSSVLPGRSGERSAPRAVARRYPRLVVWHEIEWGTVGEWIAGVGVIALWFLERRERLKAQDELVRLRYEERERARMAQVRQVEFGYSAWSYPLPPPGHHRWTIKNHSDRPLISYRFHGRMLDRPTGDERMRFGGGTMLMPKESGDVVLSMSGACSRCASSVVASA